jgi:hypothetical protein
MAVCEYLTARHAGLRLNRGTDRGDELNEYATIAARLVDDVGPIPAVLPSRLLSHWKFVAMIIGILTSILGRCLRFLSHIKEKGAMTYATRETEKASSRDDASDAFGAICSLAVAR